MRIQRRARSSNQAGVAILYAVFGAFVAASMVSVMLTMASVTRRGAQQRESSIQARYLAEGAIEAGRRAIVESLANWEEVPTEGVAVIDGETVPYFIASMEDSTVVTDEAGMETIVEGYELRAVARVGEVQETAHRVINSRTQPIFQFAVYYTNDLEINPGPNMTLGGRVHSNRSMYLSGGATLTMNTNYVRAVGDIYRRRKDNTDSTGNVQVRKWVSNPFDSGVSVEYEELWGRSDLSSMGVPSASGYDSAFDGYDANNDGDFLDDGELLPFTAGALDYWGPASGETGNGHTVLDSSHGVNEASTPRVGSIAMFEEIEGGEYVFDDTSGTYQLAGVGETGTHGKGYYHDNAGLSIIVDADGSSWIAYDGNGTDVTLDVSASGAVTMSDIYDARQSTSSSRLTTVQVDLGKLGAAKLFPSNGLLYAAHYDMGEGLDAKGVEIMNGSELADKLTVVTEGSLYLQGDYNTVDKKGASVIADAVNLLSNSWDNTKSQGNLPTASQTTFNVALVTGNHDTHGSSYNGGLENLPRFHERWSNVNCNIVGSFVNTWTSVHATSNWVYGGDRYQAPIRNWSYDTAFNTTANLPPFTPVVVTAEDVVAW